MGHIATAFPQILHINMDHLLNQAFTFTLLDDEPPNMSICILNVSCNVDIAVS